MREESYCGEKKKINKTWIEKQYTPWLQKESELYTTYCQINTQRETNGLNSSLNKNENTLWLISLRSKKNYKNKRKKNHRDTEGKFSQGKTTN